MEENPSLKPVMADAFEAAYPGALVWAVQETQVRVEQDDPDTPPFTMAQALDPEWPPSLPAWNAEQGG